MLRTKKSRLVFVWTIGSTLATLLVSYAPVMTFIFKKSLGEQTGAAFAVYVTSMVVDGAILLALAFVALCALILLISYIFTEAIPGWIKRGEEESPAAAKRKAAKALRADVKRLMIEAAKVPELEDELAETKRRLAEFQDPVDPEADGYVQPAFKPPISGMSRVDIMNTFVLSDGHSYKG